MATTSLPTRPSATILRVSVVLALMGGAAALVGLNQAPERIWTHLLLIANYLVGLALGSLTILSLGYLIGARWILAVRRIPEALIMVLPIAALLLASVFVFRPSLYSWWTAGPSEHAVPPFRQMWLQRPFFVGRALFYFAIWSVFAVKIVRDSRRSVEKEAAPQSIANARLSAAFLVVLGLTSWLATTDWLMSLEPDWSTTMYAVYNFAGFFLSSLAAVTLLALVLPSLSGPRLAIRQEYLHDWGTMLFGFSSFWMYTWFFQYFLIWYVNTPEETAYYLRRTHGNWQVLMMIDLVLNWAIPFIILLPRFAKQTPAIVAAAAVSILVGRWMDLLLMIGPSQGTSLSSPSLVDGGLAIGAIGLVGLAIYRGCTSEKPHLA